jgi:hypothetical protein
MGAKKPSRSSARAPGSELGLDDHQLRTFQKTLMAYLDLPADGSVMDAPVTVLAIEYDGRPRRGLTARCRTGRGGEHQVALADVRFPVGSEAERQVTAYRAWLDSGPVGYEEAMGMVLGDSADIETATNGALVRARCRPLGITGRVAHNPVHIGEERHFLRKALWQSITSTRASLLPHIPEHGIPARRKLLLRSMRTTDKSPSIGEVHGSVVRGSQTWRLASSQAPH